MANGFFLGGMAQGIESFEQAEAKKRALGLEEKGLGLRERALESEMALGNRRMSLEEEALNVRKKALGFEQSRALIAEADKNIGEIMKTVQETIDAGYAGNIDPAQIGKSISPLVDRAKAHAAKFGRDPSLIDAQVAASLARPSLEQVGTAQGKAALAKETAATPPRAPGVLPGEATPDEKNRLSKMTSAYKTLDTELQNYEQLVKKHGVSILPGTAERVEYDTSRRNIQMQMKELFNLGVLNGPDLMLMDSMLVDATVGRTVRQGESGVARIADSIVQGATAPIQAIYKSFTLEGATKANVKLLRQQMKTLFENQRDVIMRLPPGTTAAESQKENDPLGIRY